MEATGEYEYKPRHTAYSRFMASPSGRIARAVSGGALVGTAIARGGIRGFLIAMVGLVPFVSGVLDFCASSAMMGGPFWGEEARVAEPEE